MKTTKRSLLASGASLLLSAALLAGSTFAWFTDSVTNTGNTIQAGNLKVNFEYKDLVNDDSYETVPESATTAGKLFTDEIWEPGYSYGYDFKVSNTGSLALDWELSFQNIVCTDGANGAEIADVLEVYVLPVDAESLDGATPVGTLADLKDGVVKNGEDLAATTGTEEFSVVLKMQDGADNDYQGAKVTFDVYLRAKQATVEEDGFGSSSYDEDALYKQVNVDAGNNAAENGQALQDAILTAKPGDTIYLSAGEYDLPKNETEVISGQTGWLMPITQDNITIKGTGNTVIYSSDETPNGAYASQNVITVFGDNVTLEDLIIKPRASENKNVEVSGKNFTMKNCTVEVGSLYFSGDKGNVLVTGCSFIKDSCICFDSMGNADSVTIENNTFDGCTYYAIGNVTWTSPATLTMADVYVNGNTFNNVASILRNRMETGKFILDGNNTFNGSTLTAETVKANSDFTKHSEVTATDRVVAVVNGEEIIAD